MMNVIFVAIIVWLIGFQLYFKDFLLLSGQYNYHIGLAQCFSYIAFVIIVLSLIYDKETIGIQIALGLLGLVIAAISEFVLSKIQLSNVYYNYSVRFTVVIATAISLSSYGYFAFLPFFLMGLYVRNVKYGVPHRNTLVLAKYMKRRLFFPSVEEVEVLVPVEMPVFSHAGNSQVVNKETLSIYNVIDYGIMPNTYEDLTEKVQNLIDKVGKTGGGTVYFPRGRYMFNKSKRKDFLQINYDNIILEGETDKDGNPLTELKNCGSTVQGKANPWLSPFFITTGEQIQESNIFFGLQFRKQKKMVMRSGSMSDPGSDGRLLTPQFATKVNKTSFRGEDLIYVEDSSKIDKYIILGLYNTDRDASLLKDILGQDVIRPEWQAAARAGEEEAPSFQWLVEVKEILDNNTVRLVQPLWRDCDMQYEPAVFNVPMLENITIRNLLLNTTWNGMFRHHGHKRYYSVAQAQEMDYGWNGINMKRVAHGNIQNVIFKNFTNPLYVMDSRNITCEHLFFKGHDGHQGIKIYEHACDNLFRDIVFYNHYADMMGGEGNAYGNVFTEVKYLNPCFKPVDFDFHGFSEGPMSPPSYNLFENVYGFAYIHASGSLHMAPSCGRTNVWWNCFCEGEKKGISLFRQYYKLKLTNKDKIQLFFKILIKSLPHPLFFYKKYNEALFAQKEKVVMLDSQILHFYTDFYLYGINTISNLDADESNILHIKYINKKCKIHSLYDYQRK